MAITLATTLQSTAGEGYILKADQIACEVETITGGLISEKVKTTLAKKLEEIEKSIPEATDLSGINKDITDIKTALSALDCTKISYSAEQSLAEKLTALEKQIEDKSTSGTISSENVTYGETTVKDQLDKLNDLENISETVETVTKLKDETTKSSNLAVAAKDIVVEKYTTFTKEREEAIKEIQEEQNNVLSSLEASSDKIDSIQTIAEKLGAAFDVSDAQFNTVSEEEYSYLDKTEQLEDTKIYFCYSTDADTYTYCTITVQRNDASMGYVTGSGVYKNGSQASLLASAKEGYAFSGWSVGNSEEIVSTELQYSPTITESATYKATFYKPDAEYVVLVNLNSKNGNVEVSPESTIGDNKYKSNTELTITATPNEHYKFAKWEYTQADGQLGSDATNPKSVKVARNVTYIAYFEELSKYNITVSSSDNVAGTVSDSSKIYSDESYTIKATPNDGYQFDYWTIDGQQIADAEYTISGITTDVTAVATFSAIVTEESSDTTDNTTQET